MSLPRLFKPFKPFNPGHLNEWVTQWFDAPLGQQVLDEERKVLDQVTPALFGYYLLQTGAGAPRHMVQDCTIKQQFFVGELPPSALAGRSEHLSCICSRLTDLGLTSDSIDAALIHHTLDFDSNPHKTLREITRTILPGGTLIVVGFNPWSLWGLCRLFLRQSPALPWSSNFISPYRLSDWLNLLDFQIQGCETAVFGVPTVNRRWTRSLGWLASLGQRWWQQSGAVYVLVATKRVATVTPIKPRRRAATGNLVPLPLHGIARPTAFTPKSGSKSPDTPA